MASDLVLSAVNSPSASYKIIEGGDHSLQNRKAEASQTILKWITNLESWYRVDRLSQVPPYNINFTSLDIKVDEYYYHYG